MQNQETVHKIPQLYYVCADVEFLLKDKLFDQLYALVSDLQTSICTNRIALYDKDSNLINNIPLLSLLPNRVNLSIKHIEAENFEPYIYRGFCVQKQNPNSDGLSDGYSVTINYFGCDAHPTIPSYYVQDGVKPTPIRKAYAKESLVFHIASDGSTITMLNHEVNELLAYPRLTPSIRQDTTHGLFLQLQDLVDNFENIRKDVADHIVRISGANITLPQDQEITPPLLRTISSMFEETMKNIDDIQVRTYMKLYSFTKKAFGPLVSLFLQHNVREYKLALHSDNNLIVQLTAARDNNGDDYAYEDINYTLSLDLVDAKSRNVLYKISLVLPMLQPMVLRQAMENNTTEFSAEVMRDLKRYLAVKYYNGKKNYTPMKATNRFKLSTFMFDAVPKLNSSLDTAIQELEVQLGD